MLRSEPESSSLSLPLPLLFAPAPLPFVLAEGDRGKVGMGWFHLSQLELAFGFNFLSTGLTVRDSDIFELFVVSRLRDMLSTPSVSGSEGKSSLVTGRLDGPASAWPRPIPSKRTSSSLSSAKLPTSLLATPLPPAAA